MRLRIYSNPTWIDGEVDILHTLFEHGLECLHLRKPMASKEEYVAFLDRIDPTFYSKIITHAFWELAFEYNLGGIHIRATDRIQLVDESMTGWIKRCKASEIVAGTGAHHPKELETLHRGFQYVTLSPVFKSISKKGYHPIVKWDLKKLQQCFRYTFVGLGGMDVSTIIDAMQLGFDEIAALGAVWNRNNSVLDNFKALQQLCK